MGVSNEENDYGHKKMSYSYILFYKKDFILITYIKDEKIQMYSLIKSPMTTSCLIEFAKTMLNYQSSANFNLKYFNMKRFYQMKGLIFNARVVDIIRSNLNTTVNMHNANSTKFATMDERNFSDSLSNDNSQGESGGI